MPTAPPQPAPQWSTQFQTEGCLFQVPIVTPKGCGYCGDHQNSLGAMIAAALLESMVSTSNGFPWELVIWAGVIGFCAIPLFLWRSFRSVRSRVYEGREKKLAVVLGEQIKEKCKLLEKLSFVQKSYEGYERESSLKDVSVGKAAAEVQSLEAACES
ncbi:Melanoma inhibitory activity protein 2 [Plecturocebus cupreus]